MKPSEIIDKALTEVISSEDRWGKRQMHQKLSADFGDGTGEVVLSERWCALGALSQAAVGHAHAFDSSLEYQDPMARSLNRALLQMQTATWEVLGRNDIGVIGFNDRPDTQYEDVRAVFEKARAGLQEKGL